MGKKPTAQISKQGGEDISANGHTHVPLAAIAGVVFGLLGVVFLMTLVLVELFSGKSVADGSRMPVVFLFALTAALTTGFVGGEYAANGRVPLGFAHKAPIAFSFTGGFSIAVIFTVLGWACWGRFAVPVLMSPSDALARYMTLHFTWYPTHNPTPPKGFALANRIEFSDWLQGMTEVPGVSDSVVQLRHSLAKAPPAHDPEGKTNAEMYEFIVFSEDDLIYLRSIQETVIERAKRAAVAVPKELPIKN